MKNIIYQWTKCVIVTVKITTLMSLVAVFCLEELTEYSYIDELYIFTLCKLSSEEMLPLYMNFESVAYQDLQPQLDQIDR